MGRDGEKIGGRPMAASAISATAATAAGRDPRRLRSADLLAGAREAVIVHGQDEYRLRVTSNGKLILTK